MQCLICLQSSALTFLLALTLLFMFGLQTETGGGGPLNLLNGTLMFHEQGRSSNTAIFRGKKIPNALITKPKPSISLHCWLKILPPEQTRIESVREALLPFWYKGFRFLFFFLSMCLHYHSALINMTKSDVVILITLAQSSVSRTLRAFASCWL